MTLAPLARREREEETCQSEPSAACDPPRKEAGEPRGLASSAGVWGEPVGLCPTASQEGTRCYRVNSLALCAWRRLPWPERPDGALGRHGRRLGGWHETPMASTRRELGGWSGPWHRANPRCMRWGRSTAGTSAMGEDGPLRCPQAMGSDGTKAWTEASPSDGL